MASLAALRATPLPSPDPLVATVIAADQVTIAYDGAPVLEDVTFSVAQGDRVAIIGPNGAGKSTLMKALIGLLRVQRGTIRLNSRTLPGYVPQHQAINWEFPITVEDVVMLGLIRQIGWLRFPRRAHWLRVHGALERVGMLSYQRRQISELSGGQRQRVFIARALAQDVDVLLLDEPFAGVDVSAQADLMHVIENLHASGMTILLSTHDLALAFNRFPTVLALNRRLIGFGTPHDLYHADVLNALYGGAFLTLQTDARQVAVFADAHNNCC